MNDSNGGKQKTQTMGKRTVALGTALVLSAVVLSGCVHDTESMTIGIPSGWDGEILRSYMIEYVITEYFNESVGTDTLEAGPIYAGLAEGDIDIFAGGWQPIQAAHLEGREDRITKAGDALPPGDIDLCFAVPTYVYDGIHEALPDGIKSLEDLDDAADQFDSEITGIESGAGMMITAQEAMDDNIYNLGDWDLVESSTGTMLTVYDDAVRNKEPVVVTAWTPHFMFTQWSGEDAMQCLEDPGWDDGGETKFLYPSVKSDEERPEGVDRATINTYVNADFEEEFPEIFRFLQNFQMSVEDENELMLRLQEDEPHQALAVEYVQNNPDVLEEWLEGTGAQA